MRYFVIYLAAINILTFCVYGADKRRAKISGARRVPEKDLTRADRGGSICVRAVFRGIKNFEKFEIL